MSGLRTEPFSVEWDKNKKRLFPEEMVEYTLQLSELSSLIKSSQIYSVH